MRSPIFSLLLLSTSLHYTISSPHFPRTNHADIRADSNRDGHISLSAASADLADKHTTTNTRGAIILPNIGDTDNRCRKLFLKSPTLSIPNEELNQCHDASDDIQRAPHFMAPLKTVPLRNLGQKAVGTVSIRDSVARARVRIFRAEEGEWVFTSNEHEFPASALAAGLDLGIDARDVRHPGPKGWDGRVEVTFRIHDPEDSTRSSEDSVSLRVAPFLTNHPLQKARELFTAASGMKVLDSAGAGGEENVFQERFNANLSAVLPEPKIPVTTLQDPFDIMVQDIFEAGYVSMPTPAGPAVLDLFLRSAQDTRTAGRQVFEQIRGTGRGGVQFLGGARDEINSMGNLETVPAYEFAGRKFPAGRVVLSTHDGEKPYIHEFLAAQEVQGPPLLLNASFLAVGHTDEIVQFLPVKNSKRGWVTVVADPVAGVEILKKASKKGWGGQKAFSRPNDTEISPGRLFGIGTGLDGVYADTIDEVLAWDGIIKFNDHVGEEMEKNIQTLKSEIGLGDDEIVKIPVMLRTGLTFPKNSGIAPKRNASSEHGAALYPLVINNVILSDSQLLVPKQWGPVIHGKDIVAAAAEKVYGELGYDLLYIDDWNSHHSWGGEVHCGTNVLRQGGSWWEKRCR